MVGFLFLLLWIIIVGGAVFTWITDPEKFKQEQRRQSFFHNSSSNSQITSGWSNNSVFSDNQSSFLQNDYLTNPSNPMNPSFGQCGTLNSSSPNYVWQDLGK